MKRKYISNNRLGEYAEQSERSHDHDFREDEWRRRDTGEPSVPNAMADWGRIYSYQTVPLTAERKWELPSSATNRNHDYTRDNDQGPESYENISKWRRTIEREEQQKHSRTSVLGGTYSYRNVSHAMPRDRDHSDTTRRYENTREYSRRNEEDKQKRGPIVPDSDLPGAIDPLRKGLSGAACKWYVRYLKNGYSPEEARKLSLNRPNAVRRDNSPTPVPRPCYKKEEQLSKTCDYGARDPKADTTSTRETCIGNGSVPNSEPLRAFEDLVKKSGDASRWYLKYLNRGHSEEKARQLTLIRFKEIASPQQDLSRAQLNMTPRSSLEKEEYGAKPFQYKGGVPTNSTDTRRTLDLMKYTSPEGRVKKNRERLSFSESKPYRQFLKEIHNPEKARQLSKDRPSILLFQQEHPMKNNSKGVQVNPFPKSASEGGNAQVPSTHKEDNSLTDNGIKVAILPVDYPKVLLTRGQLTDVESALVDAMLKAETQFVGSLVFKNIRFCHGYIYLTCANTKAQDWVMQQTSSLPLWPKLKAVVGKDMPGCQTITILFPRSGGLEGKSLLHLLQMQNKDISTENWHILSEKNDEKANRQLIKALIDDVSAETIRSRDHNLYFRFGTIDIYGLKNGKISPEKFGEDAVSSSQSSVVLQDDTGTKKQSTNQIKDKTDGEDLTSTAIKRETIPLAGEKIIHSQPGTTSPMMDTGGEKKIMSSQPLVRSVQ